MEFETFSWKDRCNRYFSSLSETSKDQEQEKEKTNDFEERIERDKEKDETVCEWKDLADVQKKAVEGKLDRYIKKTLNALAIHGAGFAGKSRNRVELVVWIIIIILATVVVFGLVFFAVKDYRTSKDTFSIISLVSSPKEHSNIIPLNKVVLKFCNMNILRKSYVNGTRFEYLRHLDENIHIQSPPATSTVSNITHVIVSNANLMSLLNAIPDVDLNTVIELIREDISIQELLVKSNESMDNRLGLKGHWDLVRNRIFPSKSEIQQLGHQSDDMIVECRIGNRYCKDSEIQPAPDVELGNCFSIVTEDIASPIHVVLDAEPGEYLHAVSPSVGFLVSAYSPDRDSGKFSIAGVNRYTDIRIYEERLVVKQSSCTDSQPNGQKCVEECHGDTQMRICGCQENADEPTRTCDRDNTEQYVCMVALNILREKGKLTCSCLDSCRGVERRIYGGKGDLTFLTATSDIEWPNEHNLHRIKELLDLKGKQMNETWIRRSLLKISADLSPSIRQTMEQNHDNSVLDLLAHIGGLSALVLGLSAVGLCELLWTLCRIIVDFVRYLCNRSTNDGSLQRLTDSEITSITWAIYRQKRQMEVKNKESEINSQRRQQATIGGNVPNRLYRRSSTGSRNRDDLDQFELRTPHKGHADDTDRYRAENANNNVTIDRNGYRKNNLHMNGRLKSISEETQYQNTKNGNEIDRNGMSEHSHYKRSGHGSNKGSDHDSRYTHAYSQRSPYIQPVPMEGVRLYGGTAAYFHANTEPTYL